MKFKKVTNNDIDINLAPLIDVIFILLLFFAVSTTFNKGNHLQINLPEASSTLENKDDQSLEITVSESNDYSINGRTLLQNDFDSLRNSILSLNLNKTTLVNISADANSKHQSVITILDVLGKLGFNKINIMTKSDN